MKVSESQPLLFHLVTEKRLLGSVPRAKSHDSTKDILDGLYRNLSKTQQLLLEFPGCQLGVGVQSSLHLSPHQSSDDKQPARSRFLNGTDSGRVSGSDFAALKSRCSAELLIPVLDMMVDTDTLASQ